MKKITLKSAQAKLPELVAGLKEGNTWLITDKKKPVAKLIPAARKKLNHGRLGGSEHLITFIADDFDAPLEEFKEYME
jgi:antitoxin (DNA-binding transcriptional repressor) of toxin-antitoxin stability system